jgi:hypothetical protein
VETDPALRAVRLEIRRQVADREGHSLTPFWG